MLKYQVTLFSTLLLIGASSLARSDAPPAIEMRASMPTATQAHPEMSGAEIIANAFEFAGGHQFIRPGTLFLSGYNIIRPAGNSEYLWDHYAMWRQFADEKLDAHEASGKVRIEAWNERNLELFLAFNGSQTVDKNGLVEDESAANMWSNNFGFSAIRYALDEGWQQIRKPDDLIDGQPAYFVQLVDPNGSQTLFAFRQSDFAIVYVGFNTAKGWHERRYSHFFRKPGVNWIQPGRVRLFYNGIKANEAIWTDFTVSEPIDEALFSPKVSPRNPRW
ncbi:MAG: hypothetical protein RI942_2531 [Pseudomonadota bacterium]|jgi:hypothetical protein